MAQWANLKIVIFFLLSGGAQMAQWALGKHRNYKKEFKVVILLKLI